MTTKAENTIIHTVFKKLEQINSGTIKQLSIACNMTDAQVTAAVDRLLELNKAHVNGWDHTETSRCPVRIIKLGRGLNAPRQRKTDLIERDTTTMDIKLKMAEHRRWAASFKPHPDHAAGWLFHEPRIELLGARYEKQR
jgi:hypothetical protein